jgi:hypothetical protein
MISSMTFKGGSVNDRHSEAPTRILEQQYVIKTSSKRQQPNGKSGFELTCTSFLER